MLARLDQGSEAVVVIHVGGLYEDRAAARARWARTFERLSERARERLALENDDVSFGPADVLEIHRLTGVRLVFDHQHFWCLNPERLELRDTVEQFVRTWPRGVRPKLHFSSPRTELREIKRRNRTTRKTEAVPFAQTSPAARRTSRRVSASMRRVPSPQLRDRDPQAVVKARFPN